ncbi:MAG: glycosyltransferase [Gaiellaceae bacterium]
MFWRSVAKLLTFHASRDERALVRARIFDVFLVAVVFPALITVALLERRRSREQPRVFWGTVPLINIKYHQQAIRLYGYDSVSVVDEIYYIAPREDFDHTTWELLEDAPLSRLPEFVRQRLLYYWTFVWAVRRCDIFVFYASSLIMRHTSLKYRELWLLRLAGKKIVMLAYGADVQVAHRARNLLYKHAVAMDYPAFVRGESRTLRELEYLSGSADHIVSGVDWVYYMSWWDRLTVGHFALDTKQWAPSPRRIRGQEEKVVVFHAPNHRELKGSRFLIKACEELVAEGVPLELDLVEGVPNTVIHERMAAADIVADQFIIGWYALFSIEAMSMGKPVLCYIRRDMQELYSLYASGADCPLVNVHPLGIKEVLRELVADPELREELGRKGREYAEANHSLEAVGGMFDSIFRDLGVPPRREETAA